MPRYVGAQSQREPSSPIVFGNESPGWRGLAERDLGMWCELASDCSNEGLQCSCAGPPAHVGMEEVLWNILLGKNQPISAGTLWGDVQMLT